MSAFTNYSRFLEPKLVFHELHYAVSTIEGAILRQVQSMDFIFELVPLLRAVLWSGR